MFLAVFALVNGHKRCVGEDVLIDPDFDFHAFHKNHVLSWPKEAIRFGQRDKAFKKLE
jgi:hypothetical protein